MISANARFAVVVVLLIGAALFQHTRPRNDVLPPGRPLSSLPFQLGEWVGRDIAFSPETLASLGPGEFLQRIYQEANGSQPYVDLYLAHGPNLKSLTHHLPIDCLMGSGWSPREVGTTNLSVPGYPRFVVNRYLVVKGSERQLVLFWLRAHGRNVSSAGLAELTFNYFHFKGSDCTLVRINTPLAPGERVNDAQQRLLSFASQLNPVLDGYISG